MLEHGIPRYDETGRIFTFRAATYKDGQDVAATGRVVPDAGGNHPIMKYDYDFREIPGTYQDGIIIQSKAPCVWNICL